MSGFADLSIEEMLAGGSFTCACGKMHTCRLKSFYSGPGVIGRTAEAVASLGAKKPLVVCDRNTYEAAGETVCGILRGAGVDYQLYVLPWDPLEPDERTVGAVIMEMDPACDLILGVGSGVINDTCKVVAYATGKPQMIVGTAPSMDGYASGSSSMHKNGVKVTVYNACPSVILCDSDIIRRAPMRMLQAGFGDMIAKYVSICEWRLSHLVTGEYYCEEVARLVRRSLARIMENASGIPARDGKAIQAVTEGLVLCGVAMAYAGISRPASGLEHYFSHMWEMMAMERGEKSDLHGIQVGVGTLLTLHLYDWIRTLTPDRDRAVAHLAAFDAAEWEQMVRRVFGSTAPQILEVERKVRKNDPVAHAKRLEIILSRWQDILAIIDEELPQTERLADVMRSLGMPMTPADLGISREMTLNAFLGAREIRDKYLSCSLLWDLGMMEDALKVIGEYCQ